MKKTFAARHFECSETLKDYSLEAVDKLTTYFDRIIGADVILQPTQNAARPQSAEILIKVPGDLLTAKVEDQTYELAVHECVDILARQIRKYKTRMADH